MQAFFWEYIFELNFLIICISATTLLDKVVRTRGDLEGRLLKIYLRAVLLLAIISFLVDFAWNQPIDKFRKMQWSFLNEYSNQVFTCIEIYVFGYVFFGNQIKKLNLLLLSGLFFLGATILYIECLAGKSEWKIQLMAGELFAALELIIFSILILLRIYQLYIRQSSFDYHHLTLLLAFLGYSVISAPSFLLSNYFGYYSSNYVILFYSIHHFLWMVLSLTTWYHLRGGFRQLKQTK